MFGMNETNVVEILLLGFQNPQIFNCVLFVLCLMIYFFALAGNLFIIILVAKVQSLQSPMYIFLTQLSACDILLTTTISSNMLHVIINGRSTISLIGCIIQLNVSGASIGIECLLLTAMSYDRYLAICCPLHYSSIMGFKFCLKLVLFAWFLLFIIVLITAPLFSALQFCSNVIDHYFCDLAPFLELSCTKNTIAELVCFIVDIPFVTFPFFFIIFTYVSIFIAILRISTDSGRQKAFSTCSSHLTVVCVYYGTLITVYIAPAKGQSFINNKALSLLYTVLGPFINPIINSLRNQDIKLYFTKFISNNLRRV